MESIVVVDEIFSRDQSNPAGVSEAKVVEQIFMRLTEVWHLHVDGQLIRTTGEHPFYAYDKGWTPAQELTPEDWILTDSGDWKPVNEIWNTGELETVYNLRVADHHTYFVGDESWGWSAWVHNLYTFVSGLSVAEEVEKGLRGTAKPLSKSEKDLIIKEIRDEGVYGGVADQANLVAQIVSKVVKGSKVEQAITSYFKLSGVISERTKLESTVSTRSDKEEIDDEFQIHGWTAYIEGTYGSDALSRSYVQYENEHRPAGSARTHGHHIVYKKGSTAASDASKEGKDLLLYRGIDPYFGKENLVYAPNQGHPAAALQEIVNRLKNKGKPKSKSEMILVLATSVQDYINKNLTGI